MMFREKHPVPELRPDDAGPKKGGEVMTNRWIAVKTREQFWRAILLTGGLLVAGCRQNPASPETTEPPPPVQSGGTVSFAGKVLPVLIRYGCTSCHGGSGGLYVGSVAQLLAGGAHGPAVVAGDAGSSILIKKLSPTPPFGDRMPQGGPYLPDSTVAVISAWINEGALNN